MASVVGPMPPYGHSCAFCSLIETGQLEQVRKLILGEKDQCQCRAPQQVYRLIVFYQRFLRDSRTDSMAKAQVWRSPTVHHSPTRALVLELCAKLLAGGAPINYTTGVETPLMAALSTCDEELLWLLLDFNADVNLCDGVEDMNALGLAILLNEVSLVEILLKHGSKVNSLCCGNLVPIQLAMNKNAAVSNLLIQYGADIHQVRSVSLDDRLFTSQSPLHVAILRKNVHLGRLLLEHGEDVNQTFNDTLESPIHQAVRNLDLDMINLLIEYGADLNRPNFERHTPVGLALMIEDPVATEIAKRLVLAGASANQKTRISYFQKTYSPLHIACFKGNLDFVRFLVEEVCVRIGFWDEETEAPSSQAGREQKAQEVWTRSEQYSKGSQERYFKLLRRNERFWGSTPSSSRSSSVRQERSSSSSASTFQTSSQDYHVRSELSSSPASPGNNLAASDQDEGKSGAGLSDIASVVVGDASLHTASSSDSAVSAAAAAKGGNICDVHLGCDSKDDLVASGMSITESAEGGQEKSEEDKEPHNIVFVLGGKMVEKETVKDHWTEPPEEDDYRCNCCEFCLSPDVASSALFLVNRSTQTESNYEDSDSMEHFAASDTSGLSSSASGSAEPGADLKRGDLKSMQQESNETDETTSSAFRHSSTQTYICPNRLISRTPTQGAASDEVGPTAVATGSTMSEVPVFQAEFGSPDYDYPPQRGSWQHQFVGRKETKERMGKSRSVARFLNQVGNDGSTALFMAVYDGNIDLVDYLLQNGADPYFSSQHGNFFHAAVLAQSVPLLRRALELGCDINQVNMFGNSPLTLVSRLDLPDACELLVNSGADMNSRDRYGETPLLASVYFGCEMNARILIQHGAALDLVDDNHTSAIYWSIFNNRQRTLKLLLMAGATFTPQVFRQYPRNIRVMNNRPLFHFIQHYVHQPRSLQDLATIRVRVHMGRIKGGGSIIRDMDLLPIPKRLKEVLCLKHFINIIDTEAAEEGSAILADS